MTRQASCAATLPAGIIVAAEKYLKIELHDGKSLNGNDQQQGGGGNKRPHAMPSATKRT